MLDRSIFPDFQVIEFVHIQQVETKKLSNGLNLYTLPAGEQKIIRIELIFDAGSLYEHKPGVSSFVAKMLNEGTRQKTSLQINEYIESLGAFIEIQASLERLNLTVYCLSKHTEAVFMIINEMIAEAVFPEDALVNVKNISLQNLRLNTEKTSFTAMQLFKAKLFGEQHPYGVSFTEEHLADIQQKDLCSFYAAAVCGRPFDIILSGCVNKTQEDLAEQYFGKLILREPQLKNNLQVPAFDTLPGKHRIAKQESMQVSLRLGHLSLYKTHPDYFKILVLNEILGGYFGSRLMKNIREEKGYTYGIYSQLSHMQETGYFVIGADVQKEFAEQALEEIYKEIRRLQDEPVGEEELQTVKNYMTGSFAGSVNTAFDLADRFKSVHYRGLGYDFYASYLSNIQAMKASDLQETAQKHLSIEQMAEVASGV